MDVTLMFIFVMLRQIVAIKLNFIFVSIGDNPAYGYVSTTPAYYAALSKLKNVYPDLLNNASVYSFYDPGAYTCAQAGDKMLVTGGNISALLDKLDGFSVILTPACSAEMMVLGDYAREWNVPVLSSCAGGQELANKDRYPTVVTCAPPDHLSVSLAARDFLRMYSWNTVTFFCDDLSSYPGVGTYFYLSCRNVKKSVERKVGEFMVYVLTFDSPLVADYEKMLRTAQAQSRGDMEANGTFWSKKDWAEWRKTVVVMFTLPRVVRDIMITAHKLNMTNGDFIFLSSQLTRVPGEGVMEWKKDDGNDHIAFEAFQSLVYFQNPNPKWDKLRDIMDDINHQSSSFFNVTLTEDDLFNDYTISGYEIFYAMAIVLNETYKNPSLDGRYLTKRFLNREVKFPWRDVRFGSGAMRNADVVFYRLNTATGLLQESWRYFALTNQLKPMSSLAQVWRSGLGPPPNLPVCGYLNNQCFEKDSRIAIISSVVCVGVVAVATVASVWCWWTQRGAEGDETWWWLDAALFLAVKQELSMGKTANGGQLLKTTGLDNYGFYKGKKMWCASCLCSTTFKHAASVKKFRTVLRQLKSIHQEHVSAFSGIVELDQKWVFVFEYATRGNLRTFLDQGSTMITSDLQNSFVWDFLMGLRYLAQSSLRVHGMLSSLAVLLNERFCARIANYGVIPVLNSLGLADSSITLWTAPEVLSMPSNRMTKESDVYSAGVILGEILTQKTPFDAVPSAPVSVEEVTSMRASRKPVKFGEDFDPNVAILIRTCWEANPRDRPSLKQLMARLMEYSPKNTKSVIESLMGRLEVYSSELEKRVEDRTQELVREEEKVNTLLLEMMPASLVRKLRNKEVMLAEQYDSVTLQFSDFPAFNQLSLVSEPLYLVILLSQIYVLFDRLLERFDVYKVETIADSLLVASGLPVRNGNKHATEMCSLALALLKAAQPLTHSVVTDVPFQLRIGINSGSCVAGVVGQKMPRYCLFGDTINTASRMESHGQGGKIHMSFSTKSLLDSAHFHLEPRGLIQIKGKGLMETFWLKGVKA